MRAVALSRLPILPGRRHTFARWLAISMCSAGFPFVQAGCAHWQTAEVSSQSPAMVARGSEDDDVVQLPAPKGDTSTAADSTSAIPAPSKVLPINLDTVLHLAEVQNGQVAQARSRV